MLSTNSIQNINIVLDRWTELFGFVGARGKTMETSPHYPNDGLLFISTYEYPHAHFFLNLSKINFTRLASLPEISAAAGGGTLLPYVDGTDQLCCKYGTELTNISLSNLDEKLKAAYVTLRDWLLYPCTGNEVLCKKVSTSHQINTLKADELREKNKKDKQRIVSLKKDLEAKDRTWIGLQERFTKQQTEIAEL